MPHYFGIDLGTTNSAIAYLDANGQPVVVPNTVTGHSTTPSVVYFQEPTEVAVGDVARNAAIAEPEFVISLVKLDHGAAAEAARAKLEDLRGQLEKATVKREKYPSEKADRQVAGLEESIAKNEGSAAEFEASHAKHPDGQYLAGSVAGQRFSMLRSSISGSSS